MKASNGRHRSVADFGIGGKRALAAGLAGSAIDAALWRAVRSVLLATFDLTSLSLLKQWNWPVAIVHNLLGRLRDGGLLDRRPCCCQLARAENLTSRYFGCGTIRI
jgi:hypothetical protein